MSLTAAVVGAAVVANAAAQLPGLGVVSCPLGDGSSADAYFWDSSERITVRFLTSGCATAGNGGAIRFSISGRDIVSSLERAAPGAVEGVLHGR